MDAGEPVVASRRDNMADTTGRLIAIGDIHGCIHALDALLYAIQPRQEDTLVVLGDFVDQGPDPRDVIDRLIDLQGDCKLECLLGNHEEMLLAALQGGTARRYWEEAGGMSTVYSYRFGGSIEDIPPEHLRFIRACRDFYETSDFIFVHANLDPDLPMALQPSIQLRWAVLDPHLARGHASEKTVVVGHTEQADGEILDLGFIKCIDTACWRYGWLTALELRSGQIWQSSRFGALRHRGDPVVGPIGERRR